MNKKLLTKIPFIIGIMWPFIVIASYYANNFTYYMEKFSVFFNFLVSAK